MSSGAQIKNVLVVGAGMMGTEISAVFALAGYEVIVGDISAEALRGSADTARSRLERLVAKGRLAEAERDAALGRLSWTDDAREAAAQADFVLEAASERLATKRALFGELGSVAPAHAVLASNSSTIPSSSFAAESGRAERVCNLHFFNPPLQMACVEVIPNPLTSNKTVETVMTLARSIGKTPVLVRKETPGFIANRLMNAVQDEATRLIADGVATIEDVDVTARLALGHPMGPFELMDLVGLDVVYLMHQAAAELSGDSAQGPHPLLAAKFQAGQLGRKTGHGWYEYHDGARA